MKQEIKQTSREDIIDDIMTYELKVMEILGKREVLDDFEDWFDIKLNKVSEKRFKQLKTAYFDDLYGYLLDYSEGDLKERFEALKKWYFQLLVKKEGLK